MVAWMGVQGQMISHKGYWPIRSDALMPAQLNRSGPLAIIDTSHGSLDAIPSKLYTS